MTRMAHLTLAPVPDDASAPFFDGCAAGVLRLQRCRSCRTWSWPVVSVCRSCSSRDLAWADADGRGTVYSYSIVHKAFAARLSEVVPYVVAVVDLREGLRIVSALDAFPDGQPRIGAPVRADFAAVDGMWVPVFVPDGDETAKSTQDNLLVGCFLMLSYKVETGIKEVLVTQVQELISAGLRDAVGLAAEPQQILIDRTLIQRYLIGVGGDPADLAEDALTGLFCTVLLRGNPVWQEIRHLLPPSVLDGGGEWTFVTAPRLGDVVTVHNVLHSVEQKQRDQGPMLLVKVRTDWLGPDGRTLASCLGTAIFY